MTGYSWSTPVVDMGAVTVNGPEGQGLDEDAIGWDSIDWRACEDRVRRLRQRIFKASQEQDWPKVRSLQKLMLRSRANTLVSVRQVTQRNASTSARSTLAACPSRVPRRVARTVPRGLRRGNAPELPDCAPLLASRLPRAWDHPEGFSATKHGLASDSERHEVQRTSRSSLERDSAISKARLFASSSPPLGSAHHPVLTAR